MQAIRQYMVEALPGYASQDGIDTLSLVDDVADQFGLRKDGIMPQFLYRWADDLKHLYEDNYPSLVWANSFLENGAWDENQL